MTATASGVIGLLLLVVLTMASRTVLLPLPLAHSSAIAPRGIGSTITPPTFASHKPPEDISQRSGSLGGSRLSLPGWVILGLAALLLLALASVVWLLLRGRRRLRRARASDQDPPDPVDGVAVAAARSFQRAAGLDYADATTAAAGIRDAWRSLERWARAEGVARRPEETTADFAARCSTVLGLDAEDLDSFRALYSRATFTSWRPSPAETAEAQASLARLHEQAARHGRG